MISVKRTNSKDSDFIALVKELDEYLKVIDGDEHAFYNQFNNIDVLNHTVVVSFNQEPISCGAFKAFDENSVEIKRMYTKPTFRGKGYAAQVLKALESWAKELNYNSCILETGKRQIEAVEFYKKNNYIMTQNFGQYKNVANSICFIKHI